MDYNSIIARINPSPFVPRGVSLHAGAFTFWLAFDLITTEYTDHTEESITILVDGHIPGYAPVSAAPTSEQCNQPHRIKTVKLI